MSDRPDGDGTRATEARDDGLAADGTAEREQLRERLQQVEVNVSRIDEQYGHDFRDQIREMRRKLDEAERELEESSGRRSRGELWSSLSAEIREIEARLRR